MAIYLVFCYFFLNIISKINAQLSSVHACLKEAKDIPNNRLNGRTLAGIIGFGWDDLQSIRTKPVFFEEFKLCRAEPTGHYLLPDTIVAVPVLKVKLDEMANYYENFQDFKEEISNTFVGAASGGYAWFGASASFSKINEKTKENFAKYKSSLLYTKLQYDAFNLYQDSVGLLAPGFIDRIEQISYSVSQKLTYQAKYLAEMIVKDYGTHYVSSANTGAMIEQKTFIESHFTFEKNATLEGVRIAVAAKFGRFFNASFSNHQSASIVDQQTLTNITKSSFLETNGGPDINKILSDNATFNIDNIVPYNFNGDWLYQVVSKRNFPNISIDLLLNIQQLIKNATETYYAKNTIHGCTDMNSPNFDFKANYDDGTCMSNNDSYLFGGFYQTCKAIAGPKFRCEKLQQNNTIIGAPKCDKTLYESVKIFETIYEFEKRQETLEKVECKRKLFGHCIKFKVIVDYFDKVKIEAFWCRKKPNIKIPAENGAMFGGVYENSEPNSITGEIGCPGNFKPYKIGRNTTVCLSYQYEKDRKYSIPFAGFFSCQSAASFIQDSSVVILSPHSDDGLRNGKIRDLRSQNKRESYRAAKFIPSFGFRNNSRYKSVSVAVTRCPEGFTQQMLPIEMDCDVFYCVKKHNVGKYQHPKIIRPPYSLPEIAANKYSETNIRIIFDGIEVFSTPISNFNGLIKNDNKFKGGGLTNHSIRKSES